jgi:rhamnosyltransferase
MHSVIIPTLNASGYLPALIASLRSQSIENVEVLVVDSESEDATASVAASLGCSVYTVDRRGFDHGGVRNFAAAKATGDILVFLSQDALPISRTFLETLSAPIHARSASAAYARQIAAFDAPLTEEFARLYNYPPVSSLRHISRIRRRTLRTFFFSNAASAVCRTSFESVGGFPEPVSTNEDMLLCARLLDAGHHIAYVADAEVIHSHCLSLRQTFKRYFRIGSVVREYEGTLRSEPNTAEGVDFVRRQIAYLQRWNRYDLMPRALAEAAAKMLAYHCGRLFPQNRRGLSVPRPLRSASGD